MSRSFRPLLMLAVLSGVVVSFTACSSRGDGPVVDNVGAASPPPVSDVSDVMGSAPVHAATDISNTTVESRLARLESDVAGVKSQMVLVRPILEKMPALQDKLGQLVDELQRIDARVASAQAHVDALPPVTSGESSVPAPFKSVKMAPIIDPAPKPVVKTVMPKAVEPMKKPVDSASAVVVPESKGDEVKPSASAPDSSKVQPAPAVGPDSSGVPTLHHIRIGEDADKTRLVLDLNKKVPYTYDLDNTEKILVIDVDARNVSAVKSAQFEKSPLISSYMADVGTDGKARVVLQLRRAVKVLSTSTLPPNGDKGDRVVIDLVAM